MLNNINGFETNQNATPFRYWCHKILPMTYDDSLSYYELLCKVYHTLNEVIKSNNISIENINVLKNYIDSMRSYINNYFKNLDVQKEIDIKLDNMFESGELPNLIINILSRNKIFNTVNDMKQSVLSIGDYCRTLGYHTIGVGGGNYVITNNETPCAINIGNGLFAELLDIFVTPEQFGAYKNGNATTVTDQWGYKVGDTLTEGDDDTDSLQKAINSGRPVLLTEGVYTIKRMITIPVNVSVSITGCCTAKTFVYYTGDEFLFHIKSEHTERCVIDNINFFGTKRNGFIKADSGTWGSCFTLSNFMVNWFGEVFKLVSSFKCHIFNGDVRSFGYSTLTFDYNREPNTSFCNACTFDNVWFNPIPAVMNGGKDEYTPIVFKLEHAKNITFNGCQFDKASVIFEYVKCGVTGTTVDTILLNHCWLEKDDYIYNLDSSYSGFKKPKVINCRFSYILNNNKFKATSGEPCIDSVDMFNTNHPIYVRNHTKRGYTAFSDLPEEIYYQLQIFAENDDQRKEKNIISLSNKKFVIKLPFNSTTWKNTNASSLESTDIRSIFDYDGVIGDFNIYLYGKIGNSIKVQKMDGIFYPVGDKGVGTFSNGSASTIFTRGSDISNYTFDLSITDNGVISFNVKDSNGVAKVFDELAILFKYSRIA